MQQSKPSFRTSFMGDLIKVLQNLLCQVCYGNAEVVDAQGTWCKRCHKEFTDGMINPSKRISIVDLMKKYRKSV